MKDTIPRPPPESCTEKVFQDWILKVAKAREWRVNHVFRAKVTRPDRSEAWITTCSPGWPDLTLFRGPRLVAMEIKSKTGQVDPLQDGWLDAFAALPCAEAWVVDPTMARQVVMILR